MAVLSDSTEPGASRARLAAESSARGKCRMPDESTTSDLVERTRVARGRYQLPPLSRATSSIIASSAASNGLASRLT